MEDDKNPKSESGGQTKKYLLGWVVGGCTVVVAVVGLAFILTTPPTPAEVAEQYIEYHYHAAADAAADAVVHAAFPENPLKAEIIAGVASVAKQVIPYNCQVISETGTIVDARCNLSFLLNQPLEIRIDAPFRVSMSMTNLDVFGRAMPMVQDSNPIISEMTVNGFNLKKFKEAEVAAEKVKETIEEVKETIEEAEVAAEKVKETISEVGSDIRDLFGK